MAELVQSHPELDQLRSFSLGKLGDDALSASIAGHVETCADCRHKLETVSGDTLEVLVRGVDTAVLDAPSAPAPLPFADHPRYQITELLGSGGMGTVYKARHKLMQRDAAVKVLHQRLVDRPAAGDRFRREVRAAARLTHPNIVTAYDAEQAGDRHLLIMEFVPGRTLAELLKESGPLPIAQACS